MLYHDILESERLIFAAPTLDDASAIKPIINHPDIAKMTLSIRYPYPDDAAVKWITKLASSENINYNFLIKLKESQTIIGGIGLYLHEHFKRAAIGYWLGLDYWNKGYASEASRRLIDFGFDVLALERIEGEYFPENTASRRVMEKAGMQFEGIMRNYLQKDDMNKDNGICAIIRQDWVKKG
jgi:[ribosomal protein S5]-alanine N-acetyltransferase